MSCEDIQESLSLYCDDGLAPDARASCYQHLEVCPVCRAHLAELRSIRQSLAMLPRPSVPADLVPAINHSLIAEATARDVRRHVTFADVISELLWPRVTRYAFSSVASLGRSSVNKSNGRRGDVDDMMVVADVFSNGAASLADVMRAPRDRHMLEDFQKALRQDAAFVPADLDRRPGTMRVVYSVHRVDIR